ncbi:MAG TPA: S8 family serine peptidase [Gemmatimonadaceae bacterium]|nr:S8 family serine peptidase [Gemmatimonadaceae bacterium]
MASDPAQTVSYWYGGEEIVLHPDPARVVLSLDAAHSSRTGVQRVLTAGGVAASRIERLPQIAGHWIVELSGGASAASVAEAINHARATHLSTVLGTKFMAPVYHTDDGAEYRPVGQMIVKFRPDASQGAIDALLKGLGSTVVRPPQPDSGRVEYLISYPADSTVPLRVVGSLHASALVEWAEPDGVPSAELHSVPSDQYYALQYYLKNAVMLNGVHVDVNVEPAWDVTTGYYLVDVAVVGDGVDWSHPDFEGRVGWGWDAFSADPSQCDTDCAHKPFGDDTHGTAVAGIIAASQNNPAEDNFNLKEGISGIAPGVHITPIRIARGGQFALASRIADGINFAWTTGAAVINNSWGSDVSLNDVAQAITNAITQGRGGKGVVVVASAGNRTDRSAGRFVPVQFPARMSSVISVSAINRNGGIANYAPNSGFGTHITLVAPSSDKVPSGDLATCFALSIEDVVTTELTGLSGCNDGPDPDKPDYTQHFGGTSAAAPQVSGAAALLISADPSLTSSGVTFKLTSAADPWGPSQTYGAGKLNIGRALAPPPPPPPPPECEPVPPAVTC